MPLWPHNIHKDLHLWNLTESNDSWIQLAEANAYSFKNNPPNRRDIERFTTFLLLKEIKLEGQTQYNEFGKPFINGGKFMSISHDKNFVGIILHESDVGLDIQTAEERIHRIASKFCNNKELAQFHSTEDRTAIWCTKEAIFKFFGTDVPFAESITVKAINWDSEQIIANYSGVHGERIFTLKMKNLNNTFVVYTL